MGDWYDRDIVVNASASTASWAQLAKASVAAFFFNKKFYILYTVILGYKDLDILRCVEYACPDMRKITKEAEAFCAKVRQLAPEAARPPHINAPLKAPTCGK